MQSESQTAIVTDCSLCRLAALTTRTAFGDSYETSCAHCGEYTLTDTARVLIESLPNQFHVALSSAVRHANRQRAPLTITLQNVATLVSPFL